ncbi:hypothetical protein NX059_005300 [Plenodomus lindquistii]|nr:hypothetical protein NX059_005300 [Plenodomus lindquistii]
MQEILMSTVEETSSKICVVNEVSHPGPCHTEILNRSSKRQRSFKVQSFNLPIVKPSSISKSLLVVVILLLNLLVVLLIILNLDLLLRLGKLPLFPQTDPPLPIPRIIRLLSRLPRTRIITQQRQRHTSPQRIINRSLATLQTLANPIQPGLQAQLAMVNQLAAHSVLVVYLDSRPADGVDGNGGIEDVVRGGFEVSGAKGPVDFGWVDEARAVD